MNNVLTMKNNFRRWWGEWWKKIVLLLAVFGPATITAMADNDATGVATYSISPERRHRSPPERDQGPDDQPRSRERRVLPLDRALNAQELDRLQDPGQDGRWDGQGDEPEFYDKVKVRH